MGGKHIHKTALLNNLVLKKKKLTIIATNLHKGENKKLGVNQRQALNVLYTWAHTF